MGGGGGSGQLGENRLEVGVHIADVTHFVHPGSAVDVEAADRCTSVYLVDRRIDMLPKALTEVSSRRAVRNQRARAGSVVPRKGTHAEG